MQRGAQILYETAVAEVDAADCKVVLVSGEEITGDVIVGADGEYGLSRVEVVGQQMPGTPTGLALYEWVVFSASGVRTGIEFREQHRHRAGDAVGIRAVPRGLRAFFLRVLYRLGLTFV